MKTVDFYYKLIKDFYGTSRAERSKVLYIKHIDEGIAILKAIEASDETVAAYCLHPIFQVPNNLKKAIADKIYENIDPYILLLAMEYRNKANAYVCRARTDHYTIKDMPYMVLPEVKDMLIADKVQNYSDFLKYHKNTHKRKIELDKYFNLWFKHLEVDYNKLVSKLPTFQKAL